MQGAPSGLSPPAPSGSAQEVEVAEDTGAGEAEEVEVAEEAGAGEAEEVEVAEEAEEAWEEPISPSGPFEEKSSSSSSTEEEEEEAAPSGEGVLPGRYQVTAAGLFKMPPACLDSKAPPPMPSGLSKAPPPVPSGSSKAPPPERHPFADDRSRSVLEPLPVKSPPSAPMASAPSATSTSVPPQLPARAPKPPPPAPEHHHASASLPPPRSKVASAVFTPGPGAVGQVLE